MEIKCIDNERYSFRICIYDEMKLFVKKLEDKIESKYLEAMNMNFHVTLVPADYYMDRTLYKGPVGPMGYEGPYDQNIKQDNKPCCDKKREILNIEFCAPREWIDKNKDKLENLYVTIGPNGQKIKTFNYQEKYEYKVVKFGYYKKICFDPIYKVMKEYFPNMSELDFAKYGLNYDDYNYEKYNYDFVEKREYTNENYSINNCLESFEETIGNPINTGIYNVTISLITIDIERNTDTIIEALTDLCSYVQK